ncbi:glycosyltransferase family 2 protein [Neptunomonas sp.]|uniref:glycosyltransferase family 2 protein n=1 Tax=Neptunomonas sp. TaxID=1971898 RepID=UPI0025DDF1DB|nr:glycosyltransferase family 2 protein [Neptunomonas sp.]
MIDKIDTPEDSIVSDVTNASTNPCNQSLSVVVPFYNEEDNIKPFMEEVHAALKDYPGKWELIAVNDGSNDGTARALDKAVIEYGSHINAIHFARNFGQTAAMQTGIDAARGELIATLDGDLQNDPADIPKLIVALDERDLDMISGWRKDRQDGAINRKLPSRIANWLIRKNTGVYVNDYGCSLKVYRSWVIKQVHLIGEMHRFIPAWVACVTSPDRISDMPVNHRARQFGTSKYGISRTIRVILDLLAVFFFMRFSRRPGHFFGSIGLFLGAIGGLILTYLFGIKLFTDEDIGNRPLLFTGILFVMTSAQLITTGVLAEILTRSTAHAKMPVRPSTGAPTQRGWCE